MPGYQAEPVDGMKTSFCCPHCELLLKDPVQTEDGSRLCRECYDDITQKPNQYCTKCNITVTEEVYPDRAVQREIMKLQVFCLYRSLGCKWQGVLKDWEVHVITCTFKGVNCPHKECMAIVLAVDLETHKLECPFRSSECEHCSITLPFNQLQSHYESCSKYPVECEEEECKSLVPRDQLHVHKVETCVVQQCLLCSIKVLRSTGAELRPSNNEYCIHLSEPFQNFTHHQQLASKQLETLSNIEQLKLVVHQNFNEGRELIDELRRENKEKENTLTQLKSQIKELNTQVNSLSATNRMPSTRSADIDNMLQRIKKLESQDIHNQTFIKTIRKEIAEVKSELQTTKREIHRVSPGNTGRDMRGHEREGLDLRIVQLERRMEEVARQANMAQIQVHELELQLQASLASTYNGGFLWRIPDVSRRRRDAIEERVLSLYSPPFYTARNGYKMCIRTYLNGDGMGYKTHLSLFFVLMKGEFDALLKWPFEHKVSMILVDQDHRKHIVQTFKPTQESTSFQRPTSEMNVASGCPQFAKLSVIDEDSYVRDDVLFVKCIVDTSKIFHP